MHEQSPPDAPLVTVWDHIHLRSPDPDATAQWYEKMLGAEIIHSPGRVDLILGGQKVFISRPPMATTLHPSIRMWGWIISVCR